MHIPNLRSPYETVRGVRYFGRMIDKIRLHQAGTLPADYHANLGGGFDERCVLFLSLDYGALTARVKQGGTDEEIFDWAVAHGRKPSDEDVEVWNEFMRKRGWKDEASERLAMRKKESHFEGRDDIQTFFDYIDADEERPLREA
jgi:gluconokinase